MKIRFEITGTFPMLHHNERLADPSDEWVRLIKKITAKKSKQTDEAIVVPLRVRSRRDADSAGLRGVR